MNIRRIAGVAFTGTIAILGPVEDVAFAFNPPPNEDSDHGVPRVPLGLTTVGAFTTTVASSATIISSPISWTIDTITGQEYPIPPLEGRAQTTDQADPRSVAETGLIHVFFLNPGT